ncbi:hypothetical protein [Paraburkholderia diazotrophica]|uniref:hypothetical protein n=1 Tax=Paraburkholderia diazotrophica TaxID=667676 RepID=UPI0031750506
MSVPAFPETFAEATYKEKSDSNRKSRFSSPHAFEWFEMRIKRELTRREGPMTPEEWSECRDFIEEHARACLRAGQSNCLPLGGCCDWRNGCAGFCGPSWYADLIERNATRREQRVQAEQRAAKAVAKANDHVADVSGKGVKLWEPAIIMTEALIATPPERPKFVIDGILPTDVVFLAGRPKGGKSLRAACA